VNAGTTLKNKRKERDSPKAAQLAFSGPPEHIGANAPADRKKYLDLAFFKIKLINPSSESRTAEITLAIAAASAAVIATYSQNPL